MRPIRIHRNTVIAHHHVLSSYGTWLPNDPRGSGSTRIEKTELRDLGEIHFGRKKQQPPREELRKFHRDAKERLDFEPGWFDEAARQVIADAVAGVIRENGYTCWAFCVCSNHVHALTRIHRDEGHAIWEKIALESANALRKLAKFPEDHPVWSSRPYVVFKTTVRSVWSGIDYIVKNPEKEGLPRQHHDFVTPYDGWPQHLRKS